MSPSVAPAAPSRCLGFSSAARAPSRCSCRSPRASPALPLPVPLLLPLLDVPTLLLLPLLLPLLHAPISLLLPLLRRPCPLRLLRHPPGPMTSTDAVSARRSTSVFGVEASGLVCYYGCGAPMQMTEEGAPGYDACCKLTCQMFQMFYRYVVSVSYGCYNSRSRYYICCNGCTHIL
jgi:hypothetical protein